MKQEMLINVSQPEECRIAIVEDGLLEELYIERANADNYVGNIYKGRVVNIEPSIQAAFVDFGVGRNGFLHISDVESQYFRQGGYDPEKPIEFGGRGHHRDEPRRNQGPHEGPGEVHDDPAGQVAPDAVGIKDEEEDFDEDGPRQKGPQRRGPRYGARPRIKPPIQDILRRGDELLVQVIKEGIGTKGPTLSTYISIPGRYLVLMPALGRAASVAQNRRRRSAPQITRHHAGAKSTARAGIYRADGRRGSHEEGNLARFGLPAAAVEGDLTANQEEPRAGYYL